MSVINIEFDSVIVNIEGFTIIVCPYAGGGTLVGDTTHIPLVLTEFNVDASIVGEWKVYTEVNSPPMTAMVNCSSGVILEPLMEIHSIEDKLIFAADGSLQLVTNFVIKALDIPATEAACEAVYNTVFHHEIIGTGKAAYDPSMLNQELTMIVFEEESEVLVNTTGLNYSHLNYTHSFPEGLPITYRTQATMNGTGVAGDLLTIPPVYVDAFAFVKQ